MSWQCLAAIAHAGGGPMILCTEKAGHDGEHHHRADHAGTTDRGPTVSTGVIPSARQVVALRRVHVFHSPEPSAGVRLDFDVIVPATDTPAWFALCDQLGYRFTMRPV